MNDPWGLETQEKSACCGLQTDTTDWFWVPGPGLRGMRESSTESVQ